MKICPECGYDNPSDNEYCHECGINLKSNAIKKRNKNPIAVRLLYKLDKKNRKIRISKTKAISIISFTVIFLFIIAVGIITPNVPVTVFIIVGFLIGAIISLILYLIGYVIAGIIERLG